MIISIKMNYKETRLAKKYAKKLGVPLKEIMKTNFFEKVEEDYDVASLTLGLKEYEANPKTYTLKELSKELGI